MTISNLPVNQPEENSSDSSAVSEGQNLSEPTTSEAVKSESQNIPTPAETAPSSPAVVKEPEPEKSQYDKITDALLARTSNRLNIQRLKILLYGPPGGTKSSFLAPIPDLFTYDMEDGLISMSTQEHFTNTPKHPHQLVMPFTSFQESDLLAERFVDQNPAFEEWRVFGIDTFSTFYKKSLQQIVVKRNAIRPTGLYKNEDDDYKEANPHMLAFLDKLLLMKRHLVITAHERTVEPKNKPAKTYPDFSESLAQKIEAMMDIVGHISMMEIDGYENPVPVMRVVSDGTVHAKTRIPLPATIVNPTWAGIHEVWLEWKQKIEANS